MWCVENSGHRPQFSDRRSRKVTSKMRLISIDPLKNGTEISCELPELPYVNTWSTVRIMMHYQVTTTVEEPLLPHTWLKNSLLDHCVEAGKNIQYADGFMFPPYR